MRNIPENSKWLQSFLRLVLFFLLPVFIGSCHNNRADDSKSDFPAERKSDRNDHRKKHHRNKGYQGNQNNQLNDRNTEIPDKVYKVLEYVQRNGNAPEGYVGGRRFGNFERLLPANDSAGNKIQYQEWDVNPKVNGRNRGAERLITGSDGKAYFTNDHYRSFIEISLQKKAGHSF
ncbi:ribonuclease [Pseudarcicella hirudinis]|uniref:Ribonuclease n=1 Tax=Pseudarcicella hirudinis TaxID=1079859 RepID=A0A1I5MIV9_9BACT|nr:ribonuclease domain-containing protein [Pseudarcicella hirudinis]SFP09578.1 ribonuclease [Pseudarcicella hirudinis]